MACSAFLRGKSTSNKPARVLLGMLALGLLWILSWVSTCDAAPRAKPDEPSDAVEVSDEPDESSDAVEVSDEPDESSDAVEVSDEPDDAPPPLEDMEPEADEDTGEPREDSDDVFTAPGETRDSGPFEEVNPTPTLEEALANENSAHACQHHHAHDCHCGCGSLFAPSTGSPWENLSLFKGLDGSKQPQDLGINAQLGARFAVNWSVPVMEEFGVGAQIGTAIDYTANAIGVMDRIGGPSTRFQNFTTVGIFQRANSGWRWSMAYDFLAERYYDHFLLGQWRGLIGYAFHRNLEVGGWFTIADWDDRTMVAGDEVRLRSLNMGNFYLRQNWSNFAQTTVWVGLSSGHGQVNLLLGDERPTKTSFVYGADLQVPLTDHLALFGEANFVAPADTGTVDAYLGFVYYPAGGARQAKLRRMAPMLNVASNPTFAVDLRR